MKSIVIGVAICGSAAVFNIVVGEYLASLGWVVATLWAADAYMYSEIAEKQNKLLEDIKADLEKIASKEV